MSITDDTRSKAMPGSNGAFAFPANFLWGAATSAYQIEGESTKMDGGCPSGIPSLQHQARRTREKPEILPPITTTACRKTWL